MRDIFIAELSKLAEENSDIILITGDLGFGVLDNFAECFPDQYLNIGVAEQNMTGVATGLALEGYKVFTYSIANFTTLRCLEQIRNDACYHDANVNVVSIGGGFGYGSLGMSHHATEDLSIMRAIPGLDVIAPSNDYEAAQATHELYKKNGPSYLRLERAVVDYEISEDQSFTIGKANRLIRGKELTIIVAGGISEVAVEAANEIALSHNISVGVLSMHTIKPLDKEAIIQAVNETENIITLEENNLVGGLGSAVSEVITDNGLKPKAFKRIGLDDRFSSVVGSQEYLRKYYKMDKETIINKALDIMSHQL